MSFKNNLNFIGNPKVLATHYPEIFVEAVKLNFNLDYFDQICGNYKFHSDNKTVWSLYVERIEKDLSRESLFLNELDLPIDKQLKKILYKIASKLIKNKMNWNIGIFWSSQNNASLGSHFDDDEVYTIQLFGKKEWTIDEQNIDYLSQLICQKKVKPISSPETFSSSETWIKYSKATKLSFINPTKIIVNPGDLLITPAYALHKVRSLSDNSISLNLGICRRRNFPKAHNLYV